MVETLKELKAKYKKLSKKDKESREKRILKQEIWKLEHKGMVKTSNLIGDIGKGVKDLIVKGSKKIQEKESNKKSIHNKILKEEDLNFIP